MSLRDQSPKRAHRGLADIDAEHFVLWPEQQADLQDVAGPLLDTYAFSRLSNITFLGILSPRFQVYFKAPVYKRRSVKRVTWRGLDGSRQSHSKGVALIALELCRALAFSPLIQRYAVAWGLLHDLGNWPLSHTGQYAFEKITHRRAKETRLHFINDSANVPSRYWVGHALKKMGVDNERFTAMLLGCPDPELSPLLSVLRSPLTPDMLEGMWRSGLAFGVSVPNCSDFRVAFYRDIFGEPRLRETHSQLAVDFWKKKAEIYRRFFNAPSVALWESAWSQAMLSRFATVSFEDSLEMPEDYIVTEILKHGSPSSAELHRWKHPLRFTVRASDSTHLDRLPLRELGSILAEERIKIEEITNAAPSRNAKPFDSRSVDHNYASFDLFLRSAIQSE